MAEQIRSESFRRIKLLFTSALVITFLFSILAMVIALKTSHDEINLADNVETDRDVKHMYAIIRPFLTVFIVIVVMIEWITLAVGIIGTIREHYIMSLIFAIINAIGLICSLFQIGPVFFTLKIIWILINVILTFLSVVYVYSLRCELLRPRYNQN